MAAPSAEVPSGKEEGAAPDTATEEVQSDPVAGESKENPTEEKSE